MLHLPGEAGTEGQRCCGRIVFLGFSLPTQLHLLPVHGRKGTELCTRLSWVTLFFISTGNTVLHPLPSFLPSFTPCALGCCTGASQALLLPTLLILPSQAIPCPSPCALSWPPARCSHALLPTGHLGLLLLLLLLVWKVTGRGRKVACHP